MKRAGILGTIVAVGVIAAVVGARAQAPPPFAPVAKIQKVKDNLYTIYGMGGNSTVFVTANGVVLVDTKLANNGQAILDQIKTVTNKPVTTIINTHTHGDHTGSNDTFPASVDVVAQDNTKANMAKMTPAIKPAGMPDHTFKDKMSLNAGADRVDLYYFGRGHTNGDAIVVFPAARAMAIGDLFAWKQPPYVDTDNGGSAVELPATLERASKISDVDIVISGHIEALQKMSDVAAYAEFNRAFLTAVQNARKAGRTADQAAAELKLPAKFAGNMSGSVAGVADSVIGTAKQRSDANVKAIYAELK
jgi:glyoxylase-like metal-dependent hydrolase (beta-lactamase superfamily II)